MPDPKPTPTTKPKPKSVRVDAETAERYHAAHLAYKQATRTQISAASRHILGCQGGSWKAAGKNRAANVASMEDELLDGAVAIAEFVGAIRDGGGTAARYLKLCTAALTLAEQAMDLEDVKRADELEKKK